MASNGEESEFYYGLKNNASIANTTPTLIVTKDADGTYEHSTVANIPLSSAAIAALALKNNLIAHLEFNNNDKTVWNNGKSNVLTATSYGDGAGRSATGNEWTANGYEAGYSNTTGEDWTAIGFQAGYSSTTGDNWTANGIQAGYSNTTGNNWTANGMQAGFSNTTGNNWTAFGYRSARYIADGFTALLTLNNGVFLGADTRALADNSDNEIVIGTSAVGLGSNTSVVGNASTIFGRFWGRLLVGKSNDNGVDDLQVNGTVSAAPATLSNQVVVKSQLDLKVDIASLPKVYNALLSQSALLAPVATIVSNTLSGTPAWAYVSPGQYTLTLANAFPLGKTLIFSLIGSGTAAGDTSIKCFRNSDSEIVLNTTFNAAFTNILLTNASFKIEVYP